MGLSRAVLGLFCVVPFLGFNLSLPSRRRAESLDTSVHVRTPLLCGCLPRVVKPILKYKRSCRNGVAVLLFTLDTVLQHLRARSLLLCCSRQAVKQYSYTSVPAGAALLWCCLPWKRCSCMNARKSSRPVRVVGAWSGPFDALGEQTGTRQGGELLLSRKL